MPIANNRVFLTCVILMATAPRNLRMQQFIQTIPYYNGANYLYELSDTQQLQSPHYAYNQPSAPNYPPAIPVFTTSTTSTTTTTPQPTTSAATTEFFLPEIIVNRRLKSSGTRRPYPVYLPSSKVSSTPAASTTPDEETAAYYKYDAPVQQSNNDIAPSFSYLPPATFRNALPSLHLVLNQLRCQEPTAAIPEADGAPNSAESVGFFRALLNVQSSAVRRIEIAPVADVDFDVDFAGDSDSSSFCGIRNFNGTLIVVDVPPARFAACGVEPCAIEAATATSTASPSPSQLCMRLRFPQIAAMRTAADALLTLQCRVQERIVSQTHSIRVPVQPKSGSGSGRSATAAAAGTIAHGGTQLPYNTHVSLGRVLAGGGGGGGGRVTSVPLRFETLPAGATVRLGAELVLRAQVQPGDGWQHTRLADVQLQRLSADGRIVQAASLLDADGCVPAAMRAVCEAPVFEAPLGHRMAFRAVLFDGMRSGDEMVLSVRVVGCLRRSDCAVVSV